MMRALAVALLRGIGTAIGVAIALTAFVAMRAALSRSGI